MILRLLCLLLLASAAASGQSLKIEINPEISNTKTTRHISIPGTRLYIVPPPEFKIATNFLGLQGADNSLLNVYDLVGGNFYTNTATFSKAAFERQGARVFDYQEIIVNGYPAKFVSMQGDAATKAYALVFGDTTFSTMIFAMYPVAQESSGYKLIESLNTIWYDKEKKIDPFETANFSLNEQGSKFKFLHYNSNIYIYTIGGIEDTTDADAPMIIVTQLPKDTTITTKSLADMMIAKAQQYGLTNPQTKNESTEKINGYDSYHAEVYGQIDGKDALIYYCAISKDEKAIVFQGIAKKDIERNLDAFKKLAWTVQMK